VFEGVVVSSASGSAIDVEVGDCFSYQEDVLGCTDPEADNYDSDATIDDDSCEYSNDGPYFELTIDQTGESHLIILQDSITGLDIGDEVGVFDSNGVLYTVDIGENPEYGEVLVGTGIWSGSQLEISAIVSVNLSDFGGPILGGAVEGNPVVIKVFDVSVGEEVETDPTFASGGEFGDLFTVVPDLGLENTTDPIYGCTDEFACNYCK
jgi:hypothetical protein